MQLLRALSQQGAEIHLLSFIEPSERPEVAEIVAELGLASARPVAKQPGSRLWNALRNPFFPVTLSAFRSRAMKRAVAEAFLDHGNPDALVFDGLHTAAWLQSEGPPLRHLPPLVYRAHNVETNLWIQTARAQRNPLLRAFLNWQARLVQRFERALAVRCHQTAAVSAQDAQEFLAHYGAPQALCTPIGMPFRPAQLPPSSATSQELNLLFLGKMDWKPNREGLEWFLNSVWPEVAKRRPDIRLTLAGAGQSQWLMPYLSLPRVQFLGRVESVDSLYREAHVALVPIFVGSGTRVKAIEASSYAVACIGTELGVEGIGLDERTSYFRAEQAAQWIERLLSLTPAEARLRGQAAWESLRHRYDPAPIASALMASLPSEKSRSHP